MPEILALGARRGVYRVRKGISALRLEKVGTAPLVWNRGHCVRRWNRRRYLFQIATAFVHSSLQPDARRRGILQLLGFLTGRLLAIVAPLFSLALVVGGSLATLHLFLWNVFPPDGSLFDAGFHYEFSGLEWCDSQYSCRFVGREAGVIESSDRKADLMPLCTLFSFQFLVLRSRLSGRFGCVQLALCSGG